MKIKQFLKKLDINFKTFKHPPLYTCDDAKKHCGHISGMHSKNLFLKNRKGKKFYLVIIPEYKRADMKFLGKLASEDLKFANETDLLERLGLKPGAVSPFGLISDTKKEILVLIDKEVWESDIVNFHPNINTETLQIKGEDFQKYIKSVGQEYKII